ncbi:MAG: hypothetical protein KAG61_05930 [Bacteriovoracaceae bacterium]|nr:hypothetical protein [Bacteriovoracaceae bacterium]
MYRNFSVLIILTFLFLSCSKEKQFNLFKAELFNTLITSSQLQLVEPERADSNVVIVRPPLTWVPLFKVTVEEKRGRGELCFFYRTPHRKVKGILKLVEVEYGQRCRTVLDPLGEISIASIEGVSDLLLFTKKGTFSGAEITLTFIHNDINRSLSLPMYNMSKAIPLKRFSGSGRSRPINGISISSDLPLLDKNLHKGDSLLLQKNGEAISCHRVSSDCETVDPNICNRCRYGWFPGASGISCPQGGTKYCRPNQCGERGMPACPRGIEHRRYKIEDICIADSPAAFCRAGLRVICTAKKELICL